MLDTWKAKITVSFLLRISCLENDRLEYTRQFQRKHLNALINHQVNPIKDTY